MSKITLAGSAKTSSSNKTNAKATSSPKAIVAATPASKAATLSTDGTLQMEETGLLTYDLEKLEQAAMGGTRKNVVEYFRALLNEGRNEGDETELTDDQIWETYHEVSDADYPSRDDANKARIEAMESMEPGSVDNPLVDQRTAEQVAADISTDEMPDGGNVKAVVAGIISRAKDVAAVFDAQWDALMLSIFEAEERKRMGPIFIEQDLVRQFGDKMKDWPWPDVPAIEVKKDGTKVFHDNPDKFNYWGTNAKGNRAKKTGSFYQIAADASARGRKLTDELRLIQLALDGKKLPSGEKNPFMGQGKAALLAAKNAAEGRRSTWLKNVKTAVKLFFRLEECKRLLPRVGVAFVMREKPNSDEMELINTTQPIKIWNKKTPEDVTLVGVTTFISYDPSEAAKNGGNVAALQESGEREPEPTSGTPVNAETWEGIIGLFAGFLEDSTNAALVLKTITKGDSAAKLSVGDIFLRLSGWWHAPGSEFRRQYMLALQGQPAEQQAKANEMIKATDAAVAAEKAAEAADKEAKKKTA